MKQGLANQTVAQAIDQRQREQHQQAQRAAQAAYGPGSRPSSRPSSSSKTTVGVMGGPSAPVLLMEWPWEQWEHGAQDPDDGPQSRPWYDEHASQSPALVLV